MARPNKYNTSAYCFKIWESNKLKLEELNFGTRSSTINEALQSYFKIKSKFEAEIVFQMEEHTKIIEQHQRCYTNLEEELGKIREKERIELGNKMKLEKAKAEDLKQKYDIIVKLFKDWPDMKPYYIRQHLSKYIPNIEKYSDDKLVEIRDDILRNKWLIEKLENMISKNGGELKH